MTLFVKPQWPDHILQVSGFALLKFHHISDNPCRNLGVDK